MVRGRAHSVAVHRIHQPCGGGHGGSRPGQTGLLRHPPAPRAPLVTHHAEHAPERPLFQCHAARGARGRRVARPLPRALLHCARARAICVLGCVTRGVSWWAQAVGPQARRAACVFVRHRGALACNAAAARAAPDWPHPGDATRTAAQQRRVPRRERRPAATACGCPAHMQSGRVLTASPVRTPSACAGAALASAAAAGRPSRSAFREGGGRAARLEEHGSRGGDCAHRTRARTWLRVRAAAPPLAPPSAPSPTVRSAQCAAWPAAPV